MNKNSKALKIASGAAGALLLGSGIVAEAVNVPVADETVVEAPVEVKEYTRVANIQGDFGFDQDVLSPSDDVFNMFGTAVVGACAAPAFATANDIVTGYINVSGNLKMSFRTTLKKLANQGVETRILACSCASMGSEAVNAEVTGVKLSSIVKIADLDDGVNTVTFRGADGYGIAMPLRYALEQEALIVYQVNGNDMPEFTSNQVWVPSAVAKYFTRNIVEVEFTAESQEPDILEGARAKVKIMNDASNAVFKAGDVITFEGYADDYGVAVAAVEFSMDGGETWTIGETAGATAEKWVYWQFAYTPEAAGDYQLMVQARLADGTVSPLASVMNFSVTD